MYFANCQHYWRSIHTILFSDGIRTITSEFEGIMKCSELKEYFFIRAPKQSTWYNVFKLWSSSFIKSTKLSLKAHQIWRIVPRGFLKLSKWVFYGTIILLALNINFINKARTQIFRIDFTLVKTIFKYFFTRSTCSAQDPSI